jgi:hypothetical protein
MLSLKKGKTKPKSASVLFLFLVLRRFARLASESVAKNTKKSEVEKVHCYIMIQSD